MSDLLKETPFPVMEWDEGDSWTGELNLSFGCADLTVMLDDPDGPQSPSRHQAEAFTFLSERDDRVIASVLTALRKHYDDIRPRYEKFLGAEFPKLMPAVDTEDKLLSLIDLRQVFIYPASKDNLAYIGLLFGCTWDVEHGLGVIMHADKVVEIGGADTSFNWYPD